MRTDIATYLQQSLEGKFYHRMVDTVLSRDKNWLRWKAESCPPFQLPSLEASNYLEGQNGTQKATANKRLKSMPLGALDLGFLSEATTVDGLGKLRDPERFTLPTLDSFRGPILDDEFEIDMARSTEDKTKATEAKASKLWRALRIASRSRFGLFDKIDDGKNLDPLFEDRRNTEEPSEDTNDKDGDQVNGDNKEMDEEDSHGGESEVPTSSSIAKLEGGLRDGTVQQDVVTSTGHEPEVDDPTVTASDPT